MCCTSLLTCDTYPKFLKSVNYRAMQEVQLDSKIKLLDSPGIVFTSGSDSSASLRNAVKVSSLADPVTPANAILQRVSKQQMMEMYDITEYSSPDVRIEMFQMFDVQLKDANEYFRSFTV